MPETDQERPSQLDFWDKIKYIFSNPNFFFEQIKNETTIKNSLLMFVIVGLFFSATKFIFSFLVSLSGSYGYLSISSGFFGLSSLYSGIFDFASLILLFLLTFAYSGLIHVTVVAVKGEGGYVRSYNAFTYSLIPFLTLSVLPIIGYLSIIYSVVLAIIGISKVHNISKGKSSLACLIPLGILIGTLILIVLYFVRRYIFS